MDISRKSALLAQQQKILAKIAAGATLKEVLEDICLAIEDIMADKTATCSILSLFGKQLFAIAGPSIPKEYSEAITGVKIGPSVGSCGTAAYQKSRVIVEDISTSRLWTNFQDIASKFNFQSCWSTPILSKSSEVLGTFAIYHPKQKSASHEDLKLIDHFVHLSSIAFEKDFDSTRVKELINELETANQKLNSFIKVMPDPAIIINKQGVYVDVYSCSDELLISPAKQLIGKSVQDLLSKSDAQLAMSMIEKTLVTNEIQVFDYQLTINSKDMTFEGRTIPLGYNNQGLEEQSVLWMIRDITDRKATEDEIIKLAYYDHLTGLPNRRMLTKKLNACVAKVNQENYKGALLFIDIDNFKRINDSLGHTAGDELLIKLADRLASKIRATDTLARIGGDEFIVLLENISDDISTAKQNTIKVAEKLQESFIDKFDVGALSFQISGSMGICLIDNDNLSAEKILQFADTAMYRAKLKGGNEYSFYNSLIQTQLEKQTELEADIIRAIDDNEFCAYFQPQVNHLGEISGAEALIRWIHPEKGIVLPYEFISIAEQFGLIQKLQNIVLEDLCKLINKLLAAKAIGQSFDIAINMSQSQFNSATLKTQLLSVVDKYAVDPTRVKLEITETMLSNDKKYTIQQMKDLRALGFTFSIDDFGTGYSCLSTLSAYPVDELKIDKSFIDSMLKNDSGLPIVETIINLAKNLKMSVIAEGVEEVQQFSLLKTKGIDAIQGYLIAKPMPLDDYLVWHQDYTNSLCNAQ